MALRNLSLGTSGPDVKAIQQGLNVRRYLKSPVQEGVFDANTDYAVQDYQNKSGSTVDGIVGPKTANRCFRSASSRWLSSVSANPN